MDTISSVSLDRSFVGDGVPVRVEGAVMRDNLHIEDRWRQEHRELADESDGNALWSALKWMSLTWGCCAGHRGGVVVPMKFRAIDVYVVLFVLVLHYGLDIAEYVAQGKWLDAGGRLFVTVWSAWVLVNVARQLPAPYIALQMNGREIARVAITEKVQP